jgi:hypothetical protein
MACQHHGRAQASPGREIEEWPDRSDTAARPGSAAHSMLRGDAACGKSSTKSPWFGAAGRAVASRPGPRGSRRRWMAGPAKTAPFPERRWKRPYTRARNSMEAAFGAGTCMMSRRVRLTRVGVEQWCKRHERGRSEILPWSLGPAVAVRCGAATPGRSTNRRVWTARALAHEGDGAPPSSARQESIP